MKSTVIFILLAAFFPTSALAFSFAQPTKNDIKLAALASMALVDYQQSVQMFHEMDGYIEYNPILSSSPKRESLLTFGVVGLTIAYGINELMPEGKFKDFLFDSMLATEKMNIEENNRSIKTGKRNFEGLMLLAAFDF